MKFVKCWKWENIWLAFCTLSLLILPISIAFLAVPNLGVIYRVTPLGQLLPAVSGGLLWGTAQVTFGITIASVGMAMAFAIVVGMSAVLGSFFPMLAQQPNDLLARPGLLLMTSAVVLATGLFIYAQAARQREKDAGISQGQGDFRKGLVLCLFTGAAAGAINLGFAFSGALVERAAAHGATPQASSFAVWAVLLPAGYIPNFVYCVYLLFKNRTWQTFARSNVKEPILALTMAVLWLSGWLGYGIGATVMGTYGTSIGFAAYMTALLLWSTYLGVLTGEWRHAFAATLRRMRIGVALILTSVVVLAGAL